MAHKTVMFHSAAREKVLRGAAQLADAVRVTLGPKSKSVLMQRKWGTPLVCNDGVTVAREFELADAEENHGAQMLRQAAERTGGAAGSLALALDWPGYLIHGTNRPYGIGRRVSEGCIRLHEADIAALAAAAGPGTPVRVVDEEAKLGWSRARRRSAAACRSRSLPERSEQPRLAGDDASPQAGQSRARGLGAFPDRARHVADRGSHYFHTPKAGGRVDRGKPTQVGRALAQLGITHIASYSPEARGRMERVFGTLQGRLPAELRLAGISTLEAANRFLREEFVPAHNARFAVPAAEPGSAFVAHAGAPLGKVLCIQAPREVGRDNCVAWSGRSLQIPAQPHRHHYVRATVRVHEYPDATFAIFDGPRLLARYDRTGTIVMDARHAA